MLEGDSYLGIKLKPGLDIALEGHPDFSYSVVTDGLGFDDIGFRATAINGDVYAVAVGDSFTFGIGVDNSETWAALLQDKLALGVVNMGLPSASSQQYTRVLERYGQTLKPDVVFYGHYRADVVENVWFNMWLEAGAPGGAYHWQEWRDNYARENQNRLSDIRMYLESHSITFNLLLIPLKSVYHALPLSESARESVSPSNLEQGVVVGTTSQDEGIDIAKQSILEAQTLAEAIDSELVVLIMPDHYLLGDSELHESTTRWLLDFCDEETIRCLDLTPAFEVHAPTGRELHFPHDAHFNEAGHRVAATAICEYLASEGLLPADAAEPDCED